MQFYPADASVPTDLRTRDLQLRVLRPEHVERDYDAFMSSRERLLLWSGGNWPAADYTVERNLKDMHGHEDAYNARTQFTYTVLDPTEERAEGCIYVDSWDTVLRRSDATPESLGVGDNEGVATYWVRDSALARDLDKQLLAGLLDWFAGPEWSFARIVFRANAEQERDIECFEEAGLQRLYSVNLPAEGRTVHFYGAG